MQKKIFLCLFVFLVLFITGCSKQKEYITVYTAVNLKNAVDEIIADYEKISNKNIKVIYSGSHILLSSILLNKKGDIFLSADKVTIEIAKEKDIIFEASPISKNKLVIIVSEEGSKKIDSYKDITKKGIKLAIADDKTSSIGKSTIKFFEKNNMLDEIKNNIVIKTTTIAELLTPVIIGSVDAAIVYDNKTATGNAKKVDIPADNNFYAVNYASILKYTDNYEESKEFYKYLFSKKSMDIFLKYGYEKYE